MAWLLAVLILLTCGGDAESKLTITVHPREPVGLVRPLVLTCTFEPDQSFGYIGYKPYDMQILNGKNTVLATISRDNAPVVKNDQRRLTVEGQLASGKSDAYLKVIWSRPGRNLSGNYTCLAHARNGAGEETMFITHQRVTVKKPHLEGVLAFLQEKSAADDIAQTALANQIKALAAAQASTRPHVEEGYVDCGGSGTYKEQHPGWENSKEKRTTVVFKTPYDKTPVVNVQLELFGFDLGKASRLYVEPRDVTTKGFTVICGTWSDSVLHNLRVRWYAFNS